MHFGHTHGRAERSGLYENWIFEFALDNFLDLCRIALPLVAMHGDPRHNRNLGNLQQTLGNVLVHTDGGAEYASADKRQTGEIEQALNGTVFAKGAVHNREDHVEAVAYAAAVERNQDGVGRIGGHGDTLAAPQNIGKPFLRACTDQPVAFFGDADGHRFVRVWGESGDDGSGGSQGNFVFAGSPAKEDAHLEPFSFWGHERYFFRKRRGAKERRRGRFPGNDVLYVVRILLWSAGVARVTLQRATSRESQQRRGVWAQ